MQIGPFSMSGGGSPFKLDDKRLKEFDECVLLCPPSAGSPPLDHLVCISFFDKEKKWQTRLYDLSKLPKEVDQLMQVSGFYKMTSYGRKAVISQKKNK